jgi:malate dehydrogenase (oxaloacetate-decarboxylating)
MRECGLSQEEAANRVYIVDVDGLIQQRTKHVYDAQKPYVKTSPVLKGWKLSNPDHISMMDVVKNAHPTVLIGVSGQTGAFTKEMIEEMAKSVKRPIIFPLSNPTSKAEATPENLLQWTQGKAIIATGSPFSPVVFQGETYHIGQCNNVYVFPGVGTGALAAEAKSVTDTMFLEASKILSTFSPALKDPSASLFPPIPEVRKVCREIAIGVTKIAIKDGVSKVAVSEIEKRVDAIMWEPHYPRYTRST